MTDTYAEELLTNRFLELEGLEKIEVELDDDNDINDEEKEIEYKYPEVAFPNESFVRPKDGYWYELVFIPAEPEQEELGTGGRNRWTGIMQINVCVPKDTGTKAMNERYNAIAALFKWGLIIEGVRIVKTFRTSALDNGDYTVLPISIIWWADLER